jgi:hypothetical protein
VFLPAVRPLLTLAADLEDERNHVIPPPASSGEALEIEVVDDVERDETLGDGFEALEADAEFAHLLHSGRAVVADATRRIVVDEDDADYVGLPGLLSPEQIAHVLSERDGELRKRARSAHLEPVAEPLAEVVAWRAAGELRREVNRMVSVVAARTGASHAHIHSQLRRVVPGPASAAASVEILALRRDELNNMLVR